ncbi:Cytochrome c-type biogenesis protein CcmH (fragment) [Methylacidimicrobium sp. AP8]|uniref:tetratricopeptide repeat protein n=1 Tax=Methylacidimicrobium sp. AP8 TaxID=2730359 RepID=UPI0018C010A5
MDRLLLLLAFLAFCLPPAAADPSAAPAPQSSLARLRERAQAMPRSVEAWSSLGEALLEAGRPAEAIPAFRKAAALAPAAARLGCASAAPTPQPATGSWPWRPTSARRG